MLSSYTHNTTTSIKYITGFFYSKGEHENDLSPVYSNFPTGCTHTHTHTHTQTTKVITSANWHAAPGYSTDE